MVYYPLSVLMLAGIREILVISTPEDVGAYQRLLGDGSQWGVEFTYKIQTSPRGLADAFILGADHVGGDDVALILGDNIFHGHAFSELVRAEARNVDGCVLFGYPVSDPGRFGIGVTDATGRLVSLEEKPSNPLSNRAITGLYFYDSGVVDAARQVRPSARGELEITDLNRMYLAEGRARLVDLGRGFAWLDTGTCDSLLQAGQYVATLERRQGIRIACLEEIALRMGFIDADACHALGVQLGTSGYGRYLQEIAAEFGALPDEAVLEGRSGQPVPGVVVGVI
jgi:glucose-1-phosphate thymidylyltransferase